MTEEELKRFKYNTHSAMEILRRENYAFIAIVVYPEHPYESLLLCHTDDTDKMQAMLSAAKDLLDNHGYDSEENIEVSDKGNTQ